MPRQHSQRGFSLVEVMVAVLVIATGLIGLAGMQLVGLKSNHQSFSKNQAAHHTQALLERMRGNPAGVFADAYLVDSSTINCATAPAATCNTATSSCDSKQIAAYDIYQAFCGSKNTASGGLKRDLSQAKLAISCPVNCRTGVTIDIAWQEQVLGKEAEGKNSVPRRLSITTRIGK